MLESTMRDILAANIQALEPGLVLLKKKQFIPASIGTRSFIDLYARDAEGHHVLVELKRSDAAAREAIHEVLKYVEALKEHFRVRDDEIRVIIASTEWRELLIPFSRFHQETSINVSGVLIQEGADEGTLTATPVLPLKLINGRYLAPWHELNYYNNESRLAEGISAYEESCKHRGIEDYVLLVLDAPQGLREAAMAQAQSNLQHMLERSGVELSNEEAAKRLSRFPDYRHIVYFAMQILSRDQCLEIVALDAAESAEAQEYLSLFEDEDDPEDVLAYLHEHVYCVPPRPTNDGYEIGYPAKLNSILMQDDGWSLRIVRRYGAFSRNTLLSDEAVLDELCGGTGTTQQRFKRVFSVTNRAKVAAAKRELANCLKDNPVWNRHLQSHLSEIQREFPDAEVDVSVYNPCTGILTLFFASEVEPYITFMPTYYVLVTTDEPRRMYFGYLAAEGVPLRFRQVLDKYYDGELSGLLFTMTWGGYERRDTEILEDLGLVYRSFRCDIKGDAREFWVLREGRWRKSPPIEPFGPTIDFLKENPQLIRNIVAKLRPRWAGSMLDASSSEKELDELADLEEGLRRNVYFSPPPELCDLCECSLDEERYMIDGALKREGVWAFMCPDCFKVRGAGIGWGRGQLYVRRSSGWLLVAG